MTDAIVGRAASAGGTVGVPGDKSISHRALLFSALAEGTSTISGLALGEDVRSTARVLRDLGVEIAATEAGSATVAGRGFVGLSASAAPLDCGNSGTTIRLMMGVLAGRPFEATLFGDASLSSRPMRRVAEPLSAMGARLDLAEGGRPPVVVRGGRLAAIEVATPVASAQVKSAILLAGLQADGCTVVTEPELSRDHTERMLRAMGARIVTDGTRTSIQPGPLKPLVEYVVPGDLSSAAFLLSAGLLLPGPGLTVTGVGTNPTRTGFLSAVQSMNAAVGLTDVDKADGEPVGALSARLSRLGPLELRGALTVRAIDEVPILAVLCTQAHGRSVIADAGELRVKESDRLAAVARFLTAMGANVIERPDGLEIEGPTPLHGADVEPEGDHRIAMSAAVAALVAEGETRIRGVECAAVSFPGFFDVLRRVTDAAITAALI